MTWHKWKNRKILGFFLETHSSRLTVQDSHLHYLATFTARFSLITVTLIWPG